MKLTLLLPAVAALLFSGLPRSVQAAPETASPEEALQTTAAVFELFQAKCNDCHGAQLERPKGKFGYVMDLKRVAANEDYVVAGDASKSELYRTVFEDEMPGKDSSCGPATAAEKLALRRWIQIGAPADLPEALKARQQELLSAQAPAPKPVEKGRTLLERTLSWLGRFHAASTHFPVGLLVAAVLSEALAWWTRKESWLTCTRFLVLIGAGGAISTATLGWLNAYAGVSSVYQFHKWLGTAAAVWAVLCAGAAVLSECREGTQGRTRLRGALLIGALIISVTGFLGGAIVYGLEHYNW